jgi:predicted kinase
MNRFDQGALLDRLAAGQRLDLELMSQLGAIIAAFHESAEARRDHGGRSGMAWVIDGNVTGFAEFGRACFEGSAVDRLIDATRLELDRQGERLDRRRASGLVRQCHGDLHLRNIVVIDGRPTLFDGIEFNDEISCIDVLYDLAFLVMDLWRRQLPRHANRLWNRYLGERADLDGLPLLPLFLSCRAAVRAKTTATAAQVQQDARRRTELHVLAREYLSLASQLLRPPHSALVTIGGLSGSGKSTLASGLAPFLGPVPGAVVLRSDEVRKQLCGVSPFQRLGPEGYQSHVSERVYNTLADRADEILDGGHSVIVDAVYARREDREAIERVAADRSLPFCGFWLEAPESLLIARINSRANDPSDADANVVRAQQAQGTGHITWRRIDATLSKVAELSVAIDCVRQWLPEALNGSVEVAR